MCGLVGIVRASGLIDDERGETLRCMRDALAHRGPDDATTAVVDDWVALGHRRLAILDLAGSRQPLTDERGRVVCVFNGEIYNFQELRARLIALGHRFATRGDGEVIVHGYEEWGVEVAARLEGMFAFVLVDRDTGRVVAARDRFGIKPLFWTAQGGMVAFASELKALLEHPAISRAASRLALDLGGIRMHVPWPLTAFDGIYRLPPGALFAIERSGATTLHRYAPILDGESPRKRSSGELLDEARARLTEAVRRQMVADVPVGAFLSGGIDSTLVCALMVRLGGALHTFSVQTGPGDESDDAAESARRLGTVHHVVPLEELAFESIIELPALYDEPFAEISALGVHALSRAARQKVTVALSGDGGDEIFGGYDSYRFIHNLSRVTSLLPTRLAAPARSWAESQLRARAWPTPARRGLRALSLWGESPRHAQHRLATHVAAASTRTVLDSRRLTSLIERAAGPPLDAWDAARQAMAADRLERLPGEMLTKVDVASMAASLEVRVPLLDDAVVRFASGLESASLLDARHGKLLLRRLVAELLPGRLAWRRKRGFFLPLGAWLRRPPLARRMRELLGDQHATIHRLTGVDAPARFEQLLAGDPRAAELTSPEQILWLAAVGLWAQRFAVTESRTVRPDALPII